VVEIGKKLTYICFGFSILSDLELPELVQNYSHNPLVDITIQQGNLTQLWSWSNSKQCFVIKEKRVLFKVPETGIFLIEDGKKIIFSPEKDADEGLIRLFILGTCMGAILMQREILPLHGSAITINGKAYAFVGESGTGKSTLAAAFMKEGFPMISDDVIAVSLTENYEPMVFPSYPQQKLWQDSLSKFEMELGNFKSLYARETKYSVPAHANFYNGKLPLGGIYELVKGEEENIKIQPIKGLERFHTLYRHTYRNLFLEPLGLIDWHFTTSTKLINQLPLYQIMRPTFGFTAPEIVSLILDTVNKELNS
jgi:hypothetical protein